MRMLKYMDIDHPLSDAFRASIWRAGGNASLEHWFGPYSDYAFEIVKFVVKSALYKTHSNGDTQYMTYGSNQYSTQIGCRINKCPCDGDACARTRVFIANRITLCNSWRNLGSDEPNPAAVRPGRQGRVMLHELIHGNLHMWLNNPDDPGGNHPRDVESALCMDEDGVAPAQCYSPSNPQILAANSEDTEILMHDNIVGGGRLVRLALLNDDNYTGWLAARYGAMGTCTLPPGATVPWQPAISSVTPWW